MEEYYYINELEMELEWNWDSGQASHPGEGKTQNSSNRVK
jgi:hypothetical protein